MTVEPTIKRLKKLVEIDPYAKSKLAAKIGIASTTTIDKWLQQGKIPRLKNALVMMAIKKLEK